MGDRIDSMVTVSFEAIVMRWGVSFDYTGE